MEEVDEVFETIDDIVEELWSSPLMNHKSPFDDYKDLYEDYERNTRIPSLQPTPGTSA
ncbi:CLIP-associating protein 1 isoform X20, partial [Biomphalaria glabrata]